MHFKSQFGKALLSLLLFSVSSLPLGLLCVGAALQFMQIKKTLWYWQQTRLHDF